MASTSGSPFLIKEHVVPAQHIREYARATSSSQEAVLKLAIKQYIPKDNQDPQPGDVTVVGAHANGFPKELYEALWEELLRQSRDAGFRIRGIWIADAAWQGRSGLLNEGELGNDPYWHDHSRDLLHMINTFRSEMPLPIVGVGHSFGANALVYLSLLHPRLLHSLILFDPVITPFPSSDPRPLQGSSGMSVDKLSKGRTPAHLSATRRECWPSRRQAEETFRRGAFGRSWDPRVVDAWLRFGLRPVDGKEPDGEVTLVTTKHQEVFTFLRPSWEAFDAEGERVVRQELVPDLGPAMRPDVVQFPFYRSESPNTMSRLPEVRPSVLYCHVGRSMLSAADMRKMRLDMTGVGVGGSGGARKGRVQEVVIEEGTHLVPMEMPGECAKEAASWMSNELARWKADRDEYDEWTRKSIEEKTKLNQEWFVRLGIQTRKPKTKI